MNWRDPKEELPEQNQTVWVMLAPHKWRGDMSKSVESVQIVCGVAQIADDGGVSVLNYDELGLGSQQWVLQDPVIYSPVDSQVAIAWIPVEEMALPRWRPSWE